MGTLFNQPRRRSHAITLIEKRGYLAEDMSMESFLNQVQILSEEYEIPTAEIITAYAALVQNRAIEIQLNDHDAKDEQLAGFGEIFQEYVKDQDRILSNIEISLDNIAAALGYKPEHGEQR